MGLPLDGWVIGLPADAAASTAAGASTRAVLRSLGAAEPADRPGQAAFDGAASPDGFRAAWAASGAMALTGDLGGRTRAPAGPVAARVAGLAAAWQALAGALGLVAPEPLDGPALLGERAALLGLTRGGATSCGGSCRIVAAGDGLLAVNLPRDEDLA